MEDKRKPQKIPKFTEKDIHSAQNIDHYTWYERFCFLRFVLKLKQFETINDIVEYNSREIDTKTHIESDKEFF